MTRALLGLIALGFCSCATTHTAPRFDKPSTQTIAKATKKAIGHVQSAQGKLDELQKSHQELKLQIASIKVDLDSALTDLNTSEGARKQLETQLKDQTAKANALADSYDKAGVQITSLKASRHRWVKYFMYSSGLLALAGVWIFRKPLLLLASGFGV